MSGGTGYSAEADALAQLAQTFKIRADALSITTTGMAVGEAGVAMLAVEWGSAGTIARGPYVAATEVALTAIDAISGLLGAVGSAVEALAAEYGASEEAMAGLFDQII